MKIKVTYIKIITVRETGERCWVFWVFQKIHKVFLEVFEKVFCPLSFVLLLFVGSVYY